VTYRRTAAIGVLGLALVACCVWLVGLMAELSRLLGA